MSKKILSFVKFESNQSSKCKADFSFSFKEIKNGHIHDRHIFSLYKFEYLKRLSSVLVFNFVLKKCIPQIMILFIFEFLDFNKYFLSIFYESSENPSKLFVYLNTC